MESVEESVYFNEQVSLFRIMPFDRDDRKSHSADNYFYLR